MSAMNDDGAPRAVVVGTGRSGTGYMTHVLLANGVNAGHEGWFNPLLWGAEVEREQKPGLDVDVSWMALPYIESGEWSGPVLHVVRNPVDCIRSLEWTEHVTHPDSPFSAFARENFEFWDEWSPLEAAVEFYVDWNERCAVVADHTLRLEDVSTRLGVVTMTMALKVPTGSDETASVPMGIHARERSDSSETAIWELLAGRAARFGYPEP